MLAEVISTVREKPLRRIGKLVTRLDLFLACMTVCAEGFLVACSTCLAGVGGVKAVFLDEVEGFVVHYAVLVGMAFGTVRNSLYGLGMHYRNAAGVSTGVKDRKSQWD